ncbi:Disease resistance protein [Nymphaea thermarum]|nr:Disease resistance protein [Nymphaea thermarum]
MAQIPVEFLVKRLGAILVDEAKLQGGIRRKVDEIKSELQNMRSLLKDAESRKDEDKGNESVKTWVEQVREVAYDVEDILDEFMLHFAGPHACGFWDSLEKRFNFIKRLVERHSLATRIEDIKERTRRISEAKEKYNLNKLIEGATSINADRERLRTLVGAYLAEDTDAVGIQSDIEKLKQWLVSGDETLTTILLVGMGGLGKTTLAKKAYNSHDVRTHFQCHAWVSVSKSFHPEMVLHCLLKGSYKSMNDMFPSNFNEEKDVTVLGNALREYLRKQRYVLVLDDVRGADVLNYLSFAFPNDDCGSRIVVTSRKNNITFGIENKVEKSAKVHPLKHLSPEASMDLFCRKAFLDDPARAFPPHLQKSCEELVDSCGGLPLAIVTLGVVMSKKEQSQIEWARVHDRLGSELGDNQFLDRVGNISCHSYDELPVHLKACFLYCGIFPKNYLIKVNRLIRLWVNEGFIEQKQGMTLEEVGKQYLMELINRSLLQIVEKNIKGRVKTCKMHDLLRELVVPISTQQGFSKIISENNGSSHNGSDACAVANGKIRRLSLHGANDEYLKTLSSEQERPRIRSLFVFAAPRMPSIAYKNFILVRVLDLQGASIVELPDAVGELFLLRYLNLRRTKLKKLPTSLKKLQNLQAIDIRENQIERLPNISKMKKLRYVSAYSCVDYPFTISQISGCEFPSQVCTFQDLQKLSGINATNKIVESIGNLTQLKNLAIYKVKEDQGKKLCDSIKKMKSLLSLSVSSVSEDEPLQLESLVAPPPYLEDVWLFGHLERLPPWMGCLENLMKLGLYFSKLGQNPFFSLKSLPNLLWLKLYDAFDGTELRCYTSSFRKLKTLIIMNLTNLRSIVVEEGALPNLQTLSICECPEFRRVGEGVRRLATLRLLNLNGVSHDMVKSIGKGRGKDGVSIIVQDSFRTDDGRFYKQVL